MREKIEQVLAEAKPTLGTGDVILKDIKDGVVTIQFLKQVSACDIKSRGKMDSEFVQELLEDQIKEAVPEIKEVVVI